MILHGCPQGHRVSSETADQMYFQQFYSRVSSIPQEFCCEFNQSSKLVYYTLIINNTIEESNRQGGYFGMTLSLDCYYNNLQYIYSLFQIAFRKFVLGKVVTPTSGTYKFLIQDFSQVNETISEITKFFIDQFKLAMLPSELLDVSNFSRSGATISLNWSDCSQNIMLQNMQKVGKVFISDEYESQKVVAAKNALVIEKEKLAKEFASKEASLRGELKQEADKQNVQISSLYQQLTGLKSEKSKLESEKKELLSDVERHKSAKQQAEESARRQIAAKEQEIRQKENSFKKQIEEAGYQQELRTVAASLKEPLEKLTKLLEKVAPQESPESKGQETTRGNKVIDSIMKILPIILLCVVIGIQVFPGKNNVPSTDSNKVKQLRTEKNTLSKEVKDLQKLLTFYENLDLLKGAKINIAGRRNFRSNSENTIELEGGSYGELYKSGKWECAGCTIKPDRNNPLKTKITPPHDSTFVTVTFRLGISSITRKVEVVQQ